MSLKSPAQFGGGIKSKAVTSSLSGDVYYLKVGSFSFILPVSAYAVSKPIFDIKVTKDKTNIFTPMFSTSVKNALSFGSIAASASSKSSSGGFATYSRTSGSGGFKFGPSTGGSEFETFLKINSYHVSDE